MQFTKQNNKFTGTLIFKTVMLFIMLLGMLRLTGFAQPSNPKQLVELEKAVLSSKVINNDDRYVVFLSFSNSKDQAQVVNASGDTLQSAWTAVSKKARENMLQEEEYPWIKADIVTETETVSTNALKSRLSSLSENFFRSGIAFDSEYRTAFLEAELNANRLIRYDGKGVDLSAINVYLESNGRQRLSSLPNTVTLFSCVSWFCDENGTIYPLSDQESIYGRRIVKKANNNTAKQVITTASQYLSGQVQTDGRFIYEVYPNEDKSSDTYNILRHTGTIWSLICQYRLTGDEALKDTIDSTVDYLINNYIVYKDAHTAFVHERKVGEIKLGGNALAIVALTNYDEEFSTNQYQELCIALGNGILELMDTESGLYHHILHYPGFARAEAFRTIYYDGEATFALARLYGVTKDKKWLRAAETAVDYFIENNYTQYADHWVSYAVNEVTKHSPKQAYFDFGLRNAQENLDKIYNQKTTFHTYMELLMAAFELYDRMVENKYSSDYLQQFDIDKLTDTIYHRAGYMLNGYGYPEYVMYFKNPQQALGTFFVRQDAYRIRIDDVQHFVGGYYAFYVNYDKLQRYSK